MRSILLTLSAALVFASASQGQDASEWLEKMVTFYEKAPLAMDYTMEMTISRSRGRPWP